MRISIIILLSAISVSVYSQTYNSYYENERERRQTERLINQEEKMRQESMRTQQKKQHRGHMMRRQDAKTLSDLLAIPLIILSMPPHEDKY